MFFDAEILTQMLDQANDHTAAYMRGQMDRDTWTKEMAMLDDRMQVFGLRLTSRPWEKASGGRNI